jgi:hypothetical protein
MRATSTSWTPLAAFDAQAVALQVLGDRGRDQVGARARDHVVPTNCARVRDAQRNGRPSRVRGS